MDLKINWEKYNNHFYQAQEKAMKIKDKEVIDYIRAYVKNGCQNISKNDRYKVKMDLINKGITLI